jgi:hypothetical protein
MISWTCIARKHTTSSKAKLCYPYCSIATSKFFVTTSEDLNILCSSRADQILSQVLLDSERFS